jgi:hypothetical protein
MRVTINYCNSFHPLAPIADILHADNMEAKYVCTFPGEENHCYAARMCYMVRND